MEKYYEDYPALTKELIDEIIKFCKRRYFSDQLDIAIRSICMWEIHNKG